MPTFPLEVVFFTLTAPLSSNSDIKTVLTAQPNQIAEGTWHQEAWA